MSKATAAKGTRLLDVVPRIQGMAERVQTRLSAPWMRIRTLSSLSLFHEAAERVPAYRDFLEKHNIHPANVKTWGQFSKVPPTNKADYLKKYPLEELCWDGSLARPAVFSSTSGSTGKPFYFQRTSNLEEQYSVLLELFLGNGTKVPGPENPTLVIIGFGMGVWIGGTLTFRAFELASRRKYPVSILPAGVNKEEILKALKDLAPSFKQTILVGYPPFIKDVLDEAEFEGIDIKSLNFRFLFAAEAFTEHFRDYLGEKAGIENVCRDTLNVYGTADIGVMAFETPTSILIRRLALQNKSLYSEIFGGVEKTPTLAQYNPAYVSFEAPEGEILLTGYGSVPLVRYAVGDHGGVYSFDEINRILARAGIDLVAEAKINDVPLYELPFVYVYARTDLSTKLYGAIIYPEHVREALENPALEDGLTGKFSMQTLTDEKHNQFLEINLELKKGKKETSELRKIVTEKIVENLLKKNAEYHNNHTHFSEKVIPKLVFWNNEDPRYFKPGIKQKWVLK